MTECENLSEPGVDEVTDATDDNTDLFIAASENALHDTKRVREDCNDDGLSPIDAKKSVLHNLKFDVAYRRKFILSLSVFWSYVTLVRIYLLTHVITRLPTISLIVYCMHLERENLPCNCLNAIYIYFFVQMLISCMK